MTRSSPDRKRVEEFNRRLDALLDEDTPDSAGLSADDHQALDLARRLAALNPSIESRSRYPLRRRLLEQAARRNRRSSLWDGFLQIWEAGRPSLTPSLSLGLALVFVLAWVFTGLSASMRLDHTAIPTAYNLPVITDGSAAPLPPEDEVRIVAGFSPQPIPTPLAPADISTGAPRVRVTSLPRQTPALSAQNRPPTGAPSVIP